MVRHARKVHANQPWPHAWTTRRRSGLNIPSPGMAAPHARFVWPPALRSGITVGCRPWRIRWVLITDPDGNGPTAGFALHRCNAAAAQIVEWFVLRWQLEVTFEEARAHLGIETQRQWSDLAILRTTPALLGFVLARHSVCSSPAPRTTTTHPPGCLVYKGGPDLFRYPGLCASAPLARHHFLDVAQ